jgi:hypothetical protein
VAVWLVSQLIVAEADVMFVAATLLMTEPAFDTFTVTAFVVIAPPLSPCQVAVTVLEPSGAFAVFHWAEHEPVVISDPTLTPFTLN